MISRPLGREWRDAENSLLWAYVAPEAAGFKTARVGPSGAFYSPDFNEFLITYEDVRQAASPRAALLEFLQSMHEAGARLGGWNRAEPERVEPGPMPTTSTIVRQER